MRDSNMFVTKVLLVCATIVLVSGSPQSYGAPHQISEDALVEIREQLQFSLNKLAAGEGPDYRISRVISASSQVVSGVVYRIKAELIASNGEVKVCDVDIWDRSWLPNGIEVTIKCPNEPTVVKNHSS